MKEIPLTKGKTALVDDADYDWLCQWRWHCAAGDRYAARGNGIYMHRQIMGLPEVRNPRGENGNYPEVDHVDRDGLNNQRGNLRVCTRQQNLRNKGRQSNNRSSRFKGVTRHRQRRKWTAWIEHKYLGVFDDEVQAARVYDAAAKERFGEYARLNFPLGDIP
jgi:hypothetical protein